MRRRALLLLLALLASCSADRTVAARLPPPTTTTVAAAPTTTTTPPRRWQVRGTQIVDQDGHAFVPVGVNLLGPNSFWPYPSAGYASTARDVWKLNTVRLNVCLPRGCSGAHGARFDNGDLGALVDEYTAAGLVVMIDMHQLAPGQLPSAAELDELTAWWRATAERYRDRLDVWFNLLNEPGHGAGAPAAWLAVHARLLDAVRGTGAQNIAVLDGTQWGQEAGVDSRGPVGPATSAILAHGRELADRYGNLVYSLHVYDQWAAGGSDSERDARLGSFIDAVHGLDLPLLIGETGSYANGGNPRYAAAATSVFRVAPGKGVGILAWHGRPGDGLALTRPGGFDAVDDPVHPTNLTPVGTLLWALTHHE